MSDEPAPAIEYAVPVRPASADPLLRLVRVIACFAIGWGAASTFFSALTWDIFYVRPHPVATARIAGETAELFKLIGQSLVAIATFVAGIVTLRRRVKGLRALAWISIAAIVWSVCVRAASSVVTTWHEPALWYSSATSLAATTVSSAFSTSGLMAAVAFTIADWLKRESKATPAIG